MAVIIIYELKINAFFRTRAALDDVVKKLETDMGEMLIINQGKPDQQFSVIEQIRNYHQETPNKPCRLIKRWDNSPQTPS